MYEYIPYCIEQLRDAVGESPEGARGSVGDAGYSIVGHCSSLQVWYVRTRYR